MKDFEWRERFAPHGYHYMKRRVDFIELSRAYRPSFLLQYVIEEMQARIAKECPLFYDPSLAQTLISVYPKEVGENLNHLDPLRPRLGLEIEIRQPMPKDISVRSGPPLLKPLLAGWWDAETG